MFIKHVNIKCQRTICASKTIAEVEARQRSTPMMPSRSYNVYNLNLRSGGNHQGYNKSQYSSKTDVDFDQSVKQISLFCFVLC